MNDNNDSDSELDSLSMTIRVKEESPKSQRNEDVCTDDEEAQLERMNRNPNDNRSDAQYARDLHRLEQIRVKREQRRQKTQQRKGTSRRFRIQRSQEEADRAKARLDKQVPPEALNRSAIPPAERVACPGVPMKTKKEHKRESGQIQQAGDGRGKWKLS